MRRLLLIITSAILLASCSGTGGVSVIGDDEETYGGSGSVFGASSGSSAGGMTDSNGGELSAWDIIEKVNGGHADEVEAILSGVAEEEAAEERGFFEVSFTAEELGLPEGGYVELEILGGGADFKGKAYAGADGKVRFSRVPRQDVGSTVSIALTVYNSEDCPTCSANKCASVEAGGTTTFTMPMVDLPVVAINITGSKSSYGRKATKDGESYDVIEYTGSGLSMEVTNSDPSASVEILRNDNPASASEPLDDGFNYISVTAVKDVSLPPVVMKKRVYVVKALTEPELEFNGDHISSEDTSGYEMYRHSYLASEDWDYLRLRVTNTYDGDNAATGNATLTLKVDGSEVNWEEDQHLSDYDNNGGQTHTIELTFTKEHCEPWPVISKTIRSDIKPITLKKLAMKMNHDGDDDDGTVRLDGKIYAETKKGDAEEQYGYQYYSWDDDEMDEYHELNWDVNLPLYKRTDKFYFWTDNMIDHDTGSGKDHMGAIGWNDSHTTRSLSGLRENNSFWHKVTGDADKYNSTYDFRAELGDND